MATQVRPTSESQLFQRSLRIPGLASYASTRQRPCGSGTPATVLRAEKGLLKTLISTRHGTPLSRAQKQVPFKKNLNGNHPCVKGQGLVARPQTLLCQHVTTQGTPVASQWTSRPHQQAEGAPAQRAPHPGSVRLGPGLRPGTELLGLWPQL